jgi:hypothetical protein
MAPQLVLEVFAVAARAKRSGTRVAQGGDAALSPRGVAPMVALPARLPPSAAEGSARRTGGAQHGGRAAQRRSDI